MGCVTGAIGAGLSPATLAGLLLASFAGSFIAVALGIGGGALLLALMASLMPAASLIPVHGVIQLGSNGLRGLLLFRHVFWPPIAAFLVGSVIGAALGGSIAINLSPGLIQIGVGCFVIWSVLARPPAWLSKAPGLMGLVSSTLTMFFGATGVFVGNFTKALNLSRQAHVASHAAMMTIQHALKIAVFAMLGFAYGPWAGFILAMIAAGFLGTLAGKLVLDRLSDAVFRKALDAILVLVSVRLIWSGASSVLM